MNGADPYAELTVSMTRLESKVDRLSDKVTAGDRAGEQLVALVKQQLEHVQDGLDGIRQQLNTAAERSRTDTNQVRLDLERQIKDRTDEGNRIHAAQVDEVKELKEAHRTTCKDLYARIDRAEALQNKLIGGLVFASALGFSGLAALLRGLS